jgi:hypothetical protein
VLKDDVVASTGLVPTTSAEKALEEISSKSGRELSAFVFPEGSETLPVLRGE